MPSVPNLFIVGAPKCGTTSLYEHFRQHPAVFMPHSETKFWHHKEPSYFAQDLDISPTISVQSFDDYLSLFKGANSYQYRGDASALNLCSEVAASRIHEFNPNAKIIIMIRNPVEFMYSWYVDCVRYCHEDVMSFSKALEMEPHRNLGHKMPRKTAYPRCLEYRKMSTFSQQIERYQNFFPEHQIKICLLDDMRDNPELFFQNLADFLNIDAGQFRETDQRFHVSPSRLRTTLRYERIFYDALLEIPGSWRLILQIRKLLRPADKLANRWLPHIGDSFTEQLRVQLFQEFSDEVERLSSLLERDLSMWNHAGTTSR